MKEVFAVIAYDKNHNRSVLAQFDNFDRAEDFYFMCVEGNDREDRCDYIIESKNIKD
jgi:hypothetical protein